jgi:hypothetical protein
VFCHFPIFLATFGGISVGPSEISSLSGQGAFTRERIVAGPPTQEVMIGQLFSETQKFRRNWDNPENLSGRPHFFSFTKDSPNAFPKIFCIDIFSGT